MQSLQEVVQSLRTRGDRYQELFRAPSMSVGVYRLDVGDADRQLPHTEDEVYHVVRGVARFRAGDRDRATRAGDTFFVAAGETHGFHDIVEELVLLVVFAPAEGARAGPS